ncbi:MAG: tRNA (N(6)-L-threonylcarbamoyladenosine(37)-C(2))-methylthiotransferase MtaB [Magnetococcales bacterium]|nr:tRNA (N(6)-L-threonylcarbamoyladenosine(37)-C(2))-methylthiotransferase MtaB [Magnetococcales bacterium]
MAFITLGCRVNQCETDMLYRAGKRAGYRQAKSGETADVVVFNTCSVTGESERQARQAIRRAVREHPGARIVVTGCYAQRDPEGLARIPGVSLILGNDGKEDLFAVLANQRPDPAEADRPLPVRSEAGEFSLPGLTESGVQDRARAYLHVQNGCDAGCTFCVIPALRGASRSAHLEQVIIQAKELLAHGFQELVLMGINLGSYGRDLPSPVSLTRLIGTLLPLPGLGRLRLSSIAPQDLDPAFFAEVLAEPRFCPHLHLSIQSGDDLILKHMRRPYTRAQLLHVIHTIRARRPEIVLGADIIVGFPTEDEAAFVNTLELLQEGQIALPHIFRYSDRPGTPAARIPSHLRPSPELVRERAERLRIATQVILGDVLARTVGHELQVLVESVTQGHARGKTGEFLPLVFPAMDIDLVGKLVSVQVARVDLPNMGLVGKCGDADHEI